MIIWKNKNGVEIGTAIIAGKTHLFEIKRGQLLFFLTKKNNIDLKLFKRRSSFNIYELKKYAEKQIKNQVLRTSQF